MSNKNFTRSKRNAFEIRLDVIRILRGEYGIYGALEAIKEMDKKIKTKLLNSDLGEDTEYQKRLFWKNRLDELED